MTKKNLTRDKIVAEYLTGNITYRALGLKYGVPHRSICDWVLKYQGRMPTFKEKMRRKREKAGIPQEPELPNEIKILQAELRNTRLQNKLLEEILHISEQQTGIDFKKKFGTKQS